MNILFVCSQARLRSRTAAHLFDSPSCSCLYAGTDSSAKVPISQELVDWADKIVCMEQRNRTKVRKKFKGNSSKIITWNIPDNYDYMDDYLIVLLREKFKMIL